MGLTGALHDQEMTEMKAQKGEWLNLMLEQPLLAR